MKTKFYYLACVLLIQFAAAKAQMKIGNNPTTINSASLLELETTNQGFVLPRVSISDVSTAAPLPAGLLTGTIVYNTNSSTTGGSGIGVYYWDGSKWNFVTNTATTGANYWALTGNSGLSSSTNFIGTTDAIDFVAKTANTERMRILGATSLTSQAGWIGMGISAPRSSLDVTGNYTNKNVLTLQNTSASGFTSIDMLDNTGTLKGTFGYANASTTGNFTGKTYFNSYGSDLLFTANSGGNYHIYLKGSTGYVGINTNTPTERLHVVGNIYLNGAFMPGGDPGTSGYVLISAGAGVSPVWTNASSLAWSLTGNAGTNSVINFLGTTDNHPLKFQVNNTLSGYIDSSGGSGNTFFGYAAGLSNNITGTNNTAIGTQTLTTNTTGINNVATGYRALFSNTTGTGNTAGGYNAMYLNTTGQYNTAYGFASLRNNTTGNYNVAVGQSALQNNTIGKNNAVIGEDGMLSNTTGNYLAGVGTNVLYNNTTGSYNSALGESTMFNNTTGGYNVAMGSYTLFGNTTASNNVALGYYAGQVTTTGGNNVFVGYQAGVTNITGANNTLVGTNSGVLSTALINAGAIGYNAKTGANNSLVLGDTTTGGNAVNVGIGVRYPLKRLHIDAAPVGSSSTKDSLKIDNLASSFSAYRKALLVIDSTTGYVSRQSITTLGSGNYWSLTGNSGTNYATNFLGTTDNVSQRFRTNNIQRMIIDSVGSVGIGTSSFDPYNREKLLVNNGSTTSDNIATFLGNRDGFEQIEVQNTNSGVNASSDLVATADDGTDSTYYIDMGINSSTYAPGVENWGNQHDAYLYSFSRNLLIGTASINSDVIFMVGGGKIKNNTAVRIKGEDGNVIIGTGEASNLPIGNVLRGPSPQSSAVNTAGGNLSVQGGSSTGTATGGALNLAGGATSGTGTGGSVNITGGGTTGGTLGAVNINASTNSATNINIGSSTFSVTMGGNANNIILPKFTTVGGLYYTSVNTGQLSTTGSNMTWDSINNRLGIGITAPAYKLSVLSASNPLYLSGVQATATFTTDSVLTINAGVVKKTPYSSLTSNFWNLIGNTGVTASTSAIGSTVNNNFIGTTDAKDFVFATNNLERMRILSNGNIGINTTTPNDVLEVQGPGVTTGNVVHIRGGNVTTGNVARIAGDALTTGNVLSIGSISTAGLLNGSTALLDLIRSGVNASAGHTAYGIKTSVINTGITNTNIAAQFNASGAINNYAIIVPPGGGNVGIGTSTPGDGLDVSNKNILISNTNNTAGQLKFQEPSTSGNNYVAFKAPVTSGNTTYTLPSADGLTGQVLSTNGLATLSWAMALSSTTGWMTTGNAGTSASTNFIGTIDNISMRFRTNNVQRMIIDSLGKVGIGTNNPTSDLTIYQSSGSGSSKGFTFTGNSIGGTNTGTGFLMSLGYNTLGNKQLWVGDADYAGNGLGSFARFVVTGAIFPVLDAVSGDNVFRRYLAIGIAGDANSGVIFGGDNTGVNPGSQVWDNGNMTIGNGYKSYAAPSNGLLVQGNVGIGTTSPTSALSVLAASNPLYLSGVQATATFSSDSVLTINAGVVKKTPYSSLPGGSAWSLTGNSGTTTATNFIGTTDAVDFVAKTNNVERMRILGAISGNSQAGWIGMGTNAPTSTLDVTGSVSYDIITTTTNLTLNATHHTVIITGLSPVITLPAASSCSGRVYIIVNETGTTTVLGGGGLYIGFNAGFSSQVLSNSSMTLQSNGTNWYRIQ